MSDFYDNAPEVVKVRIDKFKELTDEGKYPYKESRFEYNACLLYTSRCV